MCGIAGFVGCGHSENSEDLATEYIKQLKHRGPDHQDYVRDNENVLCSTRLKIFDLSDAGNMPMYSADGGVVVAYNGEIYNHADLRTEIGGEWFSSSDTEVLIRAYQKWGIGCLSRLNGMFAFALYDKVLDTMFLVRDRLGIKPLYYRRSLSGINFASEPQVLSNRRPNLDTIGRFLVDGRYGDTRETFFDGVKELGAGSYMAIHNGRTVTNKYWEPLCCVGCVTRHDYYETLVDAVRIRCKADVPVGLMLSGGLDSSVIAAIAGDINCITVSYGNRETDELSQARRVVDSVGINSHHIPEVTPDFVREYMGDVVRAQGEPFGGVAVFGDFLAAMNARKMGMYVLLEGQGADECLGGYGWYRDIDDGTGRTKRIQDLRATKLPRVLRFKDRSSMAHGVEIRVPFLDHRLVGLSMMLTQEQTNNKNILRSAAEGLLPLDTVYAEKRSCVTPQTSWLRHELRGMVVDALDTLLQRGFLDAYSVRSKCSDFFEHGADNSFFVWRWLVLEHWYREFID